MFSPIGALNARYCRTSFRLTLLSGQLLYRRRQRFIALNLKLRMPFSVGEKIGPYEVLASIGAGGMGEVYKARDTRLGRTVAIKQLKGPHSARFQQEARAIAALNHPNICTLYDIGPDYLVMEYVEGVPPKGPLPREEALKLATQIASALDEAHSRGILHRDLKPANILITAKGAKLLDFGLAKFTGDSAGDATQTFEGTLAGTAAYMSPEQAKGGQADARSDVFSFGAVLYEILTGARAFAGNSMAETLSSVLRDEPRSLDGSDPLSGVAARCLRKNPLDRYPSAAALKAALEQARVTVAKARPSIAVLPFADMSPNKDNEYFADGLAEEIINALAQAPDLRVIARTSAFAFKGQNTDLRKVAEALGVSTILEGSVRKAGNRIRVTAQLITASDGSHLWSERFDRELADVFEVQDEIAASIAQTLKVKLVAGIARKHTPSAAAYETYLKARHHRGRLTRESIELYRELLERTIELDPGFALARVDMADSYLMQSTTTRDSMSRVREWAQRALEIDPDLPEVHAMMGIVACLKDYDWKEGERRFGLAMAREPVSGQIRQWYGFFCLLSSGRVEESIAEMRRGLQNDPLNLLSRQCLPLCLIAAGRMEDAELESRECLKIDANLPLAHLYFSLAAVNRGSFEEAAAEAAASLSLARWPFTIGLVAGLKAKIGDREGAEEALRDLGDTTIYGAPMGMLYYFLLNGDLNRAAEWCRKAIEQRHALLISLVLATPLAKPLRASEHWPELARMMNLPRGGLWSS